MSEKKTVFVPMSCDLIHEGHLNVIKHAKASRLEVFMTFDQGKLNINLMDDGVGFDEATIRKSSGLLNMQSRAQLIDAKFMLTSQPQSGTKLEIDYFQR